MALYTKAQRRFLAPVFVLAALEAAWVRHSFWGAWVWFAAAFGCWWPDLCAGVEAVWRWGKMKWRQEATLDKPPLM